MRCEDKTIRTGSANLFVRQFGVSGRNMVFIHGGPGWDHSYFLPFVLPLAQSFRLTFFDLRDCGRSKRVPSGYDNLRSYVDACVEDLAELLQKLSISDAALIGFSFGGRVAMKFAERYPDRLAALVLASTTAYSDYHADLACNRLYSQRMTPELKRELGELWSQQGAEDGRLARQIAFASLHLNIFDLSRINLAREVIGEILFKDLWLTGYSAEKTKEDSLRNYEFALTRISTPTLVLHGAQDLVFPVSCATRLEVGLKAKNVLLKVIPDVGHLAHIENPVGWNRAILEFLQ